MKRAALVLVVVLLVGGCSGDDGDDGDDGPTPTTTTTAPAGTRSCETIAFTPNSEDAASSVTATGLSCEEAEAFVRVAGRRTSSGGPSSVSVDGYRCVLTRSVQDPLPQAFYECTSGDKKVTFVRS